LLLWSAVYVILRDLFSKRAAGAENVLGAICGYVIAGDACGRINAIEYRLGPSAYSINPEVSALLADWQGRVVLFTYHFFAHESWGSVLAGIAARSYRWRGGCGRPRCSGAAYDKFDVSK